MNKTKIRAQIEKTIELFQLYVDCKSKLPSSDLFYSADKLHERYFEIREKCGDKKDAVRDYLNSLPTEEVIQIFSIMYAGRDYVVAINEQTEFVPFEEQFNYFNGTKKEIAISQMLSKTPLIEYLVAGMKYYSL